MLSFTTSPFSFEVDGSASTLPKLGFGDLDVAAEISANLSEDTAAGVKLVRELIMKRADKRTVEAIDKLDIPDVIKLIRAWIGLTPGESSTSGDE